MKPPHGVARAARIAAGLVVAMLSSSASAAPVPAAVPIEVDGASVRMVLKPGSPAGQLAFQARAGQRLGLGLSTTKFTPRSAAALVVTIRGPDGTLLPGFRRLHCTSATAQNPAGGCDGELTMSAPGRYVIEVDAPFSAEAEFSAFLSTTAAARLNVNASHTVSLSRPGQDARLQLPLVSPADVSVSERARSVDATRRGAFAMRIPAGRNADGREHRRFPAWSFRAHRGTARGVRNRNRSREWRYGLLRDRTAGARY